MPDRDIISDTNLAEIVREITNREIRSAIQPLLDRLYDLMDQWDSDSYFTPRDLVRLVEGVRKELRSSNSV